MPTDMFPVKSLVGSIVASATAGLAVLDAVGAVEDRSLPGDMVGPRGAPRAFFFPRVPRYSRV